MSAAAAADREPTAIVIEIEIEIEIDQIVRAKLTKAQLTALADVKRYLLVISGWMRSASPTRGFPARPAMRGRAAMTMSSETLLSDR